MHIIDTNKKLKVKSQKAKSQFKITPFTFYLVFLPFTFYLLPFLTGCVQKTDLEQAQEYLKQSQAYYQRAQEQYKDLIVRVWGFSAYFVSLPKDLQDQIITQTEIYI